MLPNASFSFCPAPLSCCSRCSSWRPPSLPSFPLRAPVRSARCVCTNSDIIISYRWKHMWLSIKVFAQGRAKHRQHKSLLLCGRTDVVSSLETCRCSHTTQTSAVCSDVRQFAWQRAAIWHWLPSLPLRDGWVTLARREQAHRCLATGQKSHVARVGETDTVLSLIVSSFITGFWFHHFSNQIPLLNLLLF